MHFALTTCPKYANNINWQRVIFEVTFVRKIVYRGEDEWHIK